MKHLHKTIKLTWRVLYLERRIIFLFNILIILFCILFVTGCVAIPVGTRIENKNVIEKNKVIENQELRNIRISKAITIDSSRLDIIGEYDESSYTEVKYDRYTKFSKKVVIGFFPGYGVYIYGTNTGASGCAEGEYLFAAPVIGFLFLGIPYIIHYTIDPFRGWETWNSNSKPESRGLPVKEMSFYVVFGMGKTHSHERINKVLNEKENVFSGKREQPVSTSIKISLENPTYSLQLDSDSSGICKYNPSSWPILSDQDLSATATASKDGITSEPCRLTIPYREVGRNIRDKLLAGGELPSKVWSNGKEVNLEVKEKGLKTFAKASAEIVSYSSNNSARIKFQIFNLGEAPLLRLVCRAETEGGAVDRIFIFERVEPGQSVSESMEISSTQILSLKSPELKIRFAEANGNQPPEIILKLTTVK